MDFNYELEKMITISKRGEYSRLVVIDKVQTAWAKGILDICAIIKQWQVEVGEDIDTLEVKYMDGIGGYKSALDDLLSLLSDEDRRIGSIERRGARQDRRISAEQKNGKLNAAPQGR